MSYGLHQPDSANVEQTSNQPEINSLDIENEMHGSFSNETESPMDRTESIMMGNSAEAHLRNHVDPVPECDRSTAFEFKPTAEDPLASMQMGAGGLCLSLTFMHTIEILHVFDKRTFYENYIC